MEEAEGFLTNAGVLTLRPSMSKATPKRGTLARTRTTRLQVGSSFLPGFASDRRQRLLQKKVRVFVYVCFPGHWKGLMPSAKKTAIQKESSPRACICLALVNPLR